MKRYIAYFVILGCFCNPSVMAQTETPEVLDEVVLSDVKLKDHSKGLKQIKLSDSLVQESKTSLTEVLRNNSLIYFRENGPGGVSSASFRGTSAAQTAVIWNGININSQLNGQTDFNTITSKNYTDIKIRKGGGSIPYGSGAIGGSIHLNNDIRFKNAFENQVSLGYGSFNSPAGNFKSRFSTQRFYGDVAVDYYKSDNDFEYLDTNRRNENGAFENRNLNANFGITLSRKQLLKVYHNTFLGDRNFSGTLTAPSRSGYQDRNSRTLAEWAILGDSFDSKLKVAHVFEQFRFFTNAENKENFSFGKAIRYTANYDFAYRFGNDKKLKAILDYTTVNGSGTSIEDTRRNTYSGILLWNHDVTKRFNYSLQLRQDQTEDFESPLLASVSSEYKVPWSSKGAQPKAFVLKANASRNYRIPTFNDLYWRGAGASGNPDLVPETSLQAEFGQMLVYGDLQIDLQSYYIETTDLIKWQPNEQGVWTPVNVSDVRNYGSNLSIAYNYKYGKHLFQVNGSYGYVKAEDVATGKALIYVPAQKIISGLYYNWEWISAQYQFLYNDSVFTTTDNIGEVAGYGVSNLHLKLQLFTKEKQKVALSLQAKNIFNKNYQTIAFRPNPGRHFLIQTTYNF